MQFIQQTGQQQPPWPQTSIPGDSVSPIVVTIGQPLYASHPQSGSGSFSGSTQALAMAIPPQSGPTFLGAPIVLNPAQGTQPHPLQPRPVPWNPPEPRQEEAHVRNSPLHQSTENLAWACISQSFFVGREQAQVQFL
jgi:hypothetical protein